MSGHEATLAGIRAQAQERRQGRALEMVPKPLLTLETIAPERPYITIDGISHRMSLPQDFALRQVLQLQRLAGRANEIDGLAVADAEVTLEQWAELDETMSSIYGDMIAIFLPTLDKRTRDALNLGQRQQLVRAYFAETQPQSSAGAAAATAPTPATGDPSSPSSAPATAGRGRTGSRKRRSATSSPPTAP